MGLKLFKCIKCTKKAKVDVNHDKNVKRYFKCIMIDKDGVTVFCKGRFCGRKPKQAASKACTMIYVSLYKDTDDLLVSKKIIFAMQECTRMKLNKKTYFYVGERIKLDEPQKIAVYVKDAITREFILDKNGDKIPMLDKDGKPVVVTYKYYNIIRKLTDTENCPEYNLLLNFINNQ